MNSGEAPPKLFSPCFRSTTLYTSYHFHLYSNLKLSSFQLIVVKPKPKQSQQPIITKVCVINNQWWLEMKLANYQIKRAGKRGRPSHDWCFVSCLIGLEHGTSFQDQSQSEVKKNHGNPGLLSTFSWKLLYGDLQRRLRFSFLQSEATG